MKTRKNNSNFVDALKYLLQDSDVDRDTGFWEHYFSKVEENYGDFFPIIFLLNVSIQEATNVLMST